MGQTRQRVLLPLEKYEEYIINNIGPAKSLNIHKGDFIVQGALHSPNTALTIANGFTFRIITGNPLARVHHVSHRRGCAWQLGIDPWDPTENLKEIFCILGSYGTVVVLFF